jgi:hypothetical protein
MSNFGKVAPDIMGPSVDPLAGPIRDLLGFGKRMFGGEESQAPGAGPILGGMKDFGPQTPSFYNDAPVGSDGYTSGSDLTDPWAAARDNAADMFKDLY